MLFRSYHTGDGKIAMILDAEGLAAQGELKFPETDKDSKAGRIPKDSSGRKTMLLFSCSGTETLGLELSRFPGLRRSGLMI